MTETIFCTEILSNGDVAKVVEIKGRHLFKSMKHSDAGEFARSLLVQCVLINDANINSEYLDDMPASSFQKLLDVISIQLGGIPT